MHRLAFLCLLLLSHVLNSLAYGGMEFIPNVGYMRGTFVTEESFAVAGPYLSFEGGYQLDLGSAAVFSLGGLARYGEFKYETNGLAKLAKWYYAGAYASAAVAVNEGLLWRLKLGYAPYSKFFVTSSTSLTVNDSTTKIKEYSLYEGGTGMEFSFSILNRSRGKNKYSPLTMWGLELGSVTQPFTVRKQRVVRSSDATSSETTENTSGTYRLSMLMLGLVVGVAF